MNGSKAPSMADQHNLQRKNQEQAREIRGLQRELENKEEDFVEVVTLLMLSKKVDQLRAEDSEH